MKSEKVTFHEFSDQWLDMKSHHVKASTIARYYFLLDRHILPVLGDYPIEEIDVEIIDSFLMQKSQQGNLRDGSPLSSKTICDIRTLILEIMKYARRKGLCNTQLDEIFIPRSNEKLITVLTISEQHQLVSFLENHSGLTELGIMLALFGGLRIGEVCALTWEDVNLQKQSLTVKKTISRIKTVGFAEEGDNPKTKLQVTTPKTNHSNREIPLTANLQELLFQSVGEIKNSASIYILTGTEHPMEPRLLLKRYKAILVKTGLPDYSFHTLRHTFATRCIEAGMDIKTLSMILGHSNVSITLQRYVHPSFDQRKRELEKLEEFFKVHT